MAKKGLAVLAVEVNDEVIEIKPNSLSFKGGLGDINVRFQTAGEGAGTNVITEDAETQVGKVDTVSGYSPEIQEALRPFDYSHLPSHLQDVRLSGQGLTRNFREMRLITDPEITVGADADYEVVFEGNAAT